MTSVRFPRSPTADKFCSGVGIEIGASAHNAFEIPGCTYVDYTADLDTVFRQEERRLAGTCIVPDIVAPADRLPFSDGNLDYVASSHVLEHVWSPVDALLEWDRVLRVGGVILFIVPHRDALAEDAARPMTPLSEVARRACMLVSRPEVDDHRHWVVGDLERWLAIVAWARLNCGVRWEEIVVLENDDKVGNGSLVCLRKIGTRDDDSAAERRRRLVLGQASRG